MVRAAAALRSATAHSSGIEISKRRRGVTVVIAFIVSNVFATMDMTGRMPNAPTGFLQRIAIIAGWAWISMVSLHFIRVTSLDSHSA